MNTKKLKNFLVLNNKEGTIDCAKIIRDAWK